MIRKSDKGARELISGAKAVDGPGTNRGISTEKDGGVIPQDNGKDAPGIRKDTRGQPKRPWLRNKKKEDKTDVFAKRVVGGTSPMQTL